MAIQFGTDLDLGGVSKLLNVPAGTGAGELVEYQQLLTLLAERIETSKITTNINATSGNIPDAPTVKAAIAAIVNSAPETLDTLKELADALGNDPNFAATISALIGTKIAKADITTDLATATTGQVPDAAALYTLIETNLTDVHRATVTLVANTNYEITHNCNRDYRDVIIQAIKADGSTLLVDRVVHPTDPMNKLYIKANSGAANVHITLMC